MDVAWYYTCPGFRDHYSILTGILEFWTAPYLSQCQLQQSTPMIYYIHLMLLSSTSFEPSFLA